MNQQDLKNILDLHRKWVLENAEGVRANLRDANLCGANLRDANLCGANLRNADLCDANLRDANLRGANLCGANLRDADLRGADLRGANLCDANLRNADLRGADLRGANLCGANLCNADLCDANLCGANLCNADLCDAKIDPICEDLFAVLAAAKPEVVGLYKALLDGRIEGRVYEGECACLIGTIANVRGCHFAKVEGLQPDAMRPAEKWFLAIRKGDTPENNPVAAITRDWLLAFMEANQIKAPKRSVVWEDAV